MGEMIMEEQFYQLANKVLEAIMIYKTLIQLYEEEAKTAEPMAKLMYESQIDTLKMVIEDLKI